MSLTSHLADKSSPVQQFFVHNYSDAGAARAALVPTEDQGVVFGRYASGAPPGKPAWRLGDPPVVPRGDVRIGYPWDAVGVAFDYRVRFFFSAREGDHRVAREGATQLVGYWTSQLGVHPAFLDVERRLSELRRAETSARGDLAFERDLGALCYVLALYEQVFRMGGPDERHPLVRMGPLADLDEILNLVPDPALDDLIDLARHLAVTQTSLLASSITANPGFTGSVYLGGADADLIAGRRLLDVKVTTGSTIERVSLWQVLGYALSDLDDVYGIEEVGLYYARHGVQVVWPVGDLLALMAGQHVEFERVRGEFGDLLRGLTSPQ